MKKIVMVAFVGVLFVCLVYQGSITFFRAETQVGTKISAGNLGIQLVETTNHEQAVFTDTGYQFHNMLPGSEIDSKTYVKNVKDKALYVRVVAEKYWEDKNGNKLPEADSELIQLLNRSPQDWIIQDDAQNSNSEIVYFYYKKPIQANEASTNVIDAIVISDELKDQTYRTYQVKVNLEAEAIQSVAAEDAVLSEWGVEITLDDNGNIQSVQG